jgi:hypothetical protein
MFFKLLITHYSVDIVQNQLNKHDIHPNNMQQLQHHTTKCVGTFLYEARKS